MRILITGGAGFLGSNLAEKLLADGAHVLSMDNLATGSPDNLPPHPRLTVIEGSVADRELVSHAFGDFRPTHVIHSAAAYKNPDDWQEDIATNVLGTANVVQAAQQAQVKRFVYFQTGLAYGRAKKVPIPADLPFEPFVSYSISKAAGEHYVAMSRLSYVSLRLANIYGPRHYSGPMPTFYKRLTQGQKCIVSETRRDFIEIQDFQALMERVLASDAVGSFNVATGRDASIKDVYLMMVELMGKKQAEAEFTPPLADDVNSLLLDPSPTERAFGWRASVPLAEGLTRLVRWFDVHGVKDAYTHLSLAKRL